MSYFSAKRDYGYVTGIIAYQNTYLKAYHQLVEFMEQNQMWLVPIGRLDQKMREEVLGLNDAYQTKRNFLTHSLPKLEQIADRCEAADYTQYLLQSTQTPDYSRARPSFFGKEDFVVWNDGMQKFLGHIQVVKDAEKKKLYNPVNWIALLLSWVLYIPIQTFKGFGFKPGKFWNTLTEQVAKILVYAALLGVGLYYFGFSKTDVGNAIRKYIGLEQQKPETPVDKTAPSAVAPTKAASSQDK